MRKVVDVAAAVILRPDGSYLLGQRPEGTPYAGWWEFPGGKVEPGESVRDALVRELQEELEITVTRAYPWLTRQFDYPHALVRLHFFQVEAWSGTVRDHQHSALAWQAPDQAVVEPMLPANAPILKALRLPRQLAITRAGEIGVTAQLQQLERRLVDGLRLVLVREPALQPDARRTFAREALLRVRQHGGQLILHQDWQLAEELGADGVHLPARELNLAGTRPALPWVGASCHNREELERAAQLELDYALLGPVLPTASHPGQAALGWASFTALAADTSLPLFALGGMTPEDQDEARTAGAHGVAGIRAFWGA